MIDLVGICAWILETAFCRVLWAFVTNWFSAEKSVCLFVFQFASLVSGEKEIGNRKSKKTEKVVELLGCLPCKVELEGVCNLLKTNLVINVWDTLLWCWWPLLSNAVKGLLYVESCTSKQVLLFQGFISYDKLSLWSDGDPHSRRKTFLRVVGGDSSCIFGHCCIRAALSCHRSTCVGSCVMGTIAVEILSSLFIWRLICWTQN